MDIKNKSEIEPHINHDKSMRKLKVAKRFILVIMLLSFIACDDFLDVQDLDTPDLTNRFQTEEDMILGMNFLYFTLPEADIEDNLFGRNSDQGYIIPYFWTDDALHRSVNNTADLQGSDFVWADNVRSLRTFYRYDDIADINFYLEQLPLVTFEDEDLRVRLEGEARFFRAWIFESASFAYGDVPLITTTLNPLDEPEQTPREEVFDYVINELNEIEEMLPWPSGYTAEDGGRITRGAVLALKARAYLNALGWQTDVASLYEGAEEACEAIINSGEYALVDGISGYEDQFLSESDLVSPETVLARIYVEGGNIGSTSSRYALQFALRGTWRGASGTAGNQARPAYTSDFIEEVQTINGLFPKDDPTYDPADPWTNRDPRLRVSAILPGDILPATDGLDVDYEYQPHPEIDPSADDMNTTINNPTGYAFKKYVDYNLDNLQSGDIDLKIIRYSEILLMYAEALAGRGDDANALTYLNMVRNRVGMPSYSLGSLPDVTRGTTGDDMIDAILLERRYEFAGEGPQRFFDIWRYRLGDQVIAPVYGIPEDPDLPGDLEGPKYPAAISSVWNRTWSDHYYLLPFFSSFLDDNPSLEQNDGY